MQNCLFCKIIAGDIPAKKLVEDEELLAFSDINPQAPNHILVIPKKHIATMNEAVIDDKELLGHMMLTGAKIAKDLQFSEPGYRLVMNCNQNGGQSVYHIHLHVLGGRAMAWPPG